MPSLCFKASFKLITRNDFFYWIERGDPFQLIRKAAWLPILGCRKLVECVLLYPIRWFFFIFCPPPSSFPDPSPAVPSMRIEPTTAPLLFFKVWHPVDISFSLSKQCLSRSGTQIFAEKGGRRSERSGFRVASGSALREGICVTSGSAQ